MTNLRPKQKEFLERYIKNNGNATQAVKDTYNETNDGYARLKGHRLITSDNITLALKDRIPDDLLVKKHKALLNKLDSKGDIETQAVSNGLSLAYRIKGLFIDKTLNINVDYSPSEEEKTKAMQALLAIE